MKLSLYEYYRVIWVVKHKRKQEKDYKFDDTYTQKEMFLQQYSNKKKQLALVILRGNLSDNKKVKDVIPGSHPKTDACRTDLAIMLLSLFVPWECLLDLFLTTKTTITTYKKFIWSVWEQYEPDLLSHIQFFAQNVCQMRKSRIEVQANAVARSETRHLARLVADNWHNQGSQPFNNDIGTNNKLASINLAEFGLLGKIFFADVVKEIYQSSW